MESANTGTLIPVVEILRNTQTKGLYVRLQGENLTGVVFFSAAIGDREGLMSGGAVRVEAIQDILAEPFEEWL